jgi:hypothetical protein
MNLILKHDVLMSSTPTFDSLRAFNQLGTLYATTALTLGPRIDPMAGFIANAVTAAVARLAMRVGVAAQLRIQIGGIRLWSGRTIWRRLNGRGA